MAPIAFDPVLAASVWLQFTLYRKWIPARLWSIEGRSTIWPLVTLLALGMQVVHVSAGGFTVVLPADGADALHMLIEAVITAAGAVIIHGGASAAGVQQAVEQVATFGGRTNIVAQHAATLVQQTATTLPAPERDPAERIISDFLQLANMVQQAQRALTVITQPPPPAAVAPAESTVQAAAQ